MKTIPEEGYQRECEALDVLQHTPPRITLVIRPPRPDDHDAIRAICCETALLGDPIDPLFHDRRLFADLLTRPYLEYEPGSCRVAAVNNRVVGYLLGSIRHDFDRILLQTGAITAGRMLWKLLTGRYSAHPGSGRFVRWMFSCGWRERPRHPTDAAHLHFNVKKEFRGHGIGRRLWLDFENHLRDARVRRYYGEFFSWGKRRPERIYTRYGFKEFDRKNTTMFERLVPQPVEIVCMQKVLGPV